MKAIVWLRERLKSIDGRYFLFGSHLTLVLIAKLYYELPRTFFQIGFAYAVAAAVELILHFTLKKYPNATVGDRALSAVSEAAGVLLLIHSNLWFIHAAVSAIAVSSKYFFTRRDGIHIYNPTNFGIVAALTLFPMRYFSVFADEYAAHGYPILHVIAFGSFAVWYGRTYLVTLGYLGGLMASGLVAQWWSAQGFITVVYPEIGTFGMIFAFLMITDPKTTPKSSLGKFLFGLSVLGMMLTLRHLQFVYYNFIALFLVAIARHLHHLATTKAPPMTNGRGLPVVPGPARRLDFVADRPAA